MQTITKIKRPWNLTPPKYRELSRLNMRGEGNMSKNLATIRKQNNKLFMIDGWSIAIYRTEDELLLGHAILSRRKPNNYSNWTKSQAEFYIRQEFRRQGLGRRLAYHVRKTGDKARIKEIEVIAWNTRSKEFFESLVNRDKLDLNLTVL